MKILGTLKAKWKLLGEAKYILHSFLRLAKGTWYVIYIFLVVF